MLESHLPDEFFSFDIDLGGSSNKTPVLTPRSGNSSPFTGITVDKSVEFSYEELSKATDDFSISNKIGEGGFGAVYYAELRGEVCDTFIITEFANEAYFCSCPALVYLTKELTLKFI